LVQACVSRVNHWGAAMIELRDYQQAAVGEIRAAFGRHRRVLFQLVTGGGKTVIFGFIPGVAED
jgi:superfamily II DNA or RNA helicase